MWCSGQIPSGIPWTGPELGIIISCFIYYYYSVNAQLLFARQKPVTAWNSVLWRIHSLHSTPISLLDQYSRVV